MNAGPVILRELRAEARHGLNYRLRVFAMVPVLFVSGVVILESGADARTLGMMLFTGVHLTLLTLICLVGPTLTADCISREKREGTLGLLFLTPLKPSEIVVGKSFVHLLRAFTLWLAALPVLTIPFMLGGITWAGVGRAISFQFAFGLLTLGAGLLASAFTSKSVRAVVAAELFALSLISLLVAGLALAYSVQGTPLPPPFIDEFDSAYERAFALAALVMFRLLDACDLGMRGFPLGGGAIWTWLTVGAVVFSLLAFALVVWLAAWRVRTAWREEPLSARQARWHAALFTPRFWVGRLRETMTRRLARNPILWLQTYSPTARLVKWGWCSLVVGYACFIGVLDQPAYLFRDTHAALLSCLLLGMAFSAANSFRNERENGALELLLVTPLTVKQIIGGRVRGLWSQYLPAVVVFAALALVIRGLGLWTPPWWDAEPRQMWWRYVLVLASLPVVGLFFSLRMSFQLLATAAVVFLGALWPLSMPGMVSYAVKRASFHLNTPFEEMFPPFLVSETSAFWFLLTLALVVGLCGYQLQRDLARRNFSFTNR